MITVQLTPEAPITEMDESLLLRSEGVVNDDNEYTTWVEYHVPGNPRAVHRSVHVRLKKGVFGESAVGSFNER